MWEIIFRKHKIYTYKGKNNTETSYQASVGFLAF